MPTAPKGDFVPAPAVSDVRKPSHHAKTGVLAILQRSPLWFGTFSAVFHNYKDPYYHAGILWSFIEMETSLDPQSPGFAITLTNAQLKSRLPASATRKAIVQSKKDLTASGVLVPVSGSANTFRIDWVLLESMILESQRLGIEVVVK